MGTQPRKMAEAAVRRLLPKDEHIVMAWIGSVVGLVGVSKLTSKKAPEVPVVKAARAASEFGGLEDIPELAEALGVQSVSTKGSRQGGNTEGAVNIVTTNAGGPSARTLFICRHAERQDHLDPTWAATATRPHDSPLSHLGASQAGALGAFISSRLAP